MINKSNRIVGILETSQFIFLVQMHCRGSQEVLCISNVETKF